MEKEEHYIASFLIQPKFKKWVLENDPLLDSYWKAYIRQYPEQEEALECAKVIISELSINSQPWEKKGKEELLARILKQLEDPGMNPKKSLQLSERSQKSNYLKPLIFSVLIFFLIGLFFLQKVEMETINDPNPELETIKWVKRSTKKGQKSKIHLADGSIVTLNAHSEIKYHNQFGISNRDIVLIGEAFFEVAEDSIPFRVISDELVTTALGTAFNINNYENRKPSVMLASGKVSVQNQRAKLYLHPGEKAILHENDSLKKQEFNLHTALLWKDGILNFEKEPLQEVFHQLEWWYGIEFRIMDHFDQDAIVSGRFDNDNLENVLETITYSIPFQYEIKNKEVYIHPKMQ